MKIANLHTFHIPVMGLAYTIDSPIRVAHLGISSVISVMDDELMERMNKFYSEKFELPYQEISSKMEDFRSRRITAYLNTVDHIVNKKFQDLKSSLMENKKAVEDFVNTLPNVSELRNDLQHYLEDHLSLDYLQSALSKFFAPGAIDVNIMTKLDREHYTGKEQLPIQYNDAHAALRGFAQSNLNASVVLSAGMNPRLYAYFENFENFFPTENTLPQKRIILKVSDYRSALIQGQQLAKKGLWVSEYRVESGLNCGGHAFATDGQMMGHILEEFKEKRQEFIETTHQLLCKSLLEKNRFVPSSPLSVTITAQGGIGTAKEHQFLLEHYQLDSIGWGSPFLLVPEATSTDIQTRKLLANAKEEDLYLSDISPLGVPFNTIKGTTNENLKQERIYKNNPGSSCPRKYLALDRSFFSEGSCTADRKHQKIALAQLKENEANLIKEEYTEQFKKITEKSCLCVGLANASLLEQNLPIKGQAQGVVVCPGPNIAYFTKEASLNEMIDHIYGRDNLIETTNRPNFLIKELKMYVEHYQKERNECEKEPTNQRIKKMNKLKDNLLDGIQYYKTLFNADKQYFYEDNKTIQAQLNTFEKELTLD